MTASKQAVPLLRQNQESCKDESGYTEITDNPLRTLSVRGHGQVECSPDNFQMTIVLNSSKPSVEEAETSVKKRSDYIFQVLRNNGIGEDCIKSHTDVGHDNQTIVLKTSLKVISDDFNKISRAKKIIKEKLDSSVQCSSIGCYVSFSHLMSQRYVYNLYQKSSSEIKT